MQRRKLDRDAGRRLGRDIGVRLRGTSQCIDRVAIGRQVARRVGARERRLAEHVERVTVTGVLALGGTRQRLLDRASHHELVAHDLHGLAQCRAHDRLADAADQPAHEAAGIARGGSIRLHDATGQHQAPGRGVDEQARLVRQVRGPVTGIDLLGDQPVGRVGIRYAQQRLGQTHQDHAFLRSQVVLAQKRIHAAARHARTAHLAHQVDGARMGFAAGRVGQARERQDLAQHARLIGEPQAIDGIAHGGRERLARAADQGGLGLGHRANSGCTDHGV